MGCAATNFGASFQMDSTQAEGGVKSRLSGLPLNRCMSDHHDASGEKGSVQCRVEHGGAGEGASEAIQAERAALRHVVLARLGQDADILRHGRVGGELHVVEVSLQRVRIFVSKTWPERERTGKSHFCCELAVVVSTMSSVQP